MKLWIANQIVRLFYAVLQWSFKVKMATEQQEEILFEFTPIEQEPVDKGEDELTRRGFSQLFGAAMLAVSISMPKFFEAVTGKATVLIKGVLDSGQKFEEVVFLDKWDPKGIEHIGYYGKSELSWKDAEVVSGSCDVQDRSVLVEWAKDFDPTAAATSGGRFQIVGNAGVPAWGTEITEEVPKGLVTGYEDWQNQLGAEDNAKAAIRSMAAVRHEDLMSVEADFQEKQNEALAAMNRRAGRGWEDRAKANAEWRSRFARASKDQRIAMIRADNHPKWYEDSLIRRNCNGTRKEFTA